MTREFLSVTIEDTSDPLRLAHRLNTMLQQIQERLDRMEGVRGIAQIQGRLDIVDSDGNLVGGFSDS